MPSAGSVQTTLTDDHDRLNELFEGFQEWKQKDFARAREFWLRFRAGLLYHIAYEETALFPAYEQKTGKTGPTDTLRGEHREIKEWLEALHARVEAGDADSAHEETMLFEELGGHNAREERAFYPELERLLSGVEKAAVFKSLADASG